MKLAAGLDVMSEERPKHPADEGFILKHPIDERERMIYVRHQERVAYLRKEYQYRLNALNKWYDCQKVMTFDGLVQELEAINR